MVSGTLDASKNLARVDSQGWLLIIPEPPQNHA